MWECPFPSSSEVGVVFQVSWSVLLKDALSPYLSNEVKLEWLLRQPNKVGVVVL